MNDGGRQATSDHVSAARLHDLVEGLLPPEEARTAERHVEGCAACRDARLRLREVVAALGALPREARAPEEVWAGVRARLAGARPSERPDGLAARRPAHHGRVRLSFSVPQLAAAALVVSVLSAGAVWVATSGAPERPSRAAVEPSLPGPGAAVRAARTGLAGYEERVARLEELAAVGREALAPETREVLDRSLTSIEEALADVRRALATDPGSALLERLLASHERTRLRVLRQMATAVEPRS